MSGVVWSFERDGNYVSFGGPIGLIYKNSRETAVSVTGVVLELSSVSDVVSSDPEQIKDLLDAADRYCVDEGFILREKSGAGIHTNDGKVFLIEYCGPDA